MPPDLEFDSDVRRRIYEYVERQGAADFGEVRDAVRVDADPAGAKPTRSGVTETVPLSPSAFAEHAAALVDDGYLHEDDGTLRVAVEATPETVELDDGTAVTVRPAREADSEGVRAVMSEVAAEGDSIVAETVAEALGEEPLVRRTGRRSRMVFVATLQDGADGEDGETGEDGVIGWVHVDAPEFEKLRHTAELTVGVRDAHRERGVGGRLLERGLEWAREQDYRKVYQSVPATNDAAVDFLEAHGWRVEGTREDHYLVDGTYVDEVMLARWLEPDGE